MASACCTLAISAPIDIALMVLFGWFAFYNPDPEECWVSAQSPDVAYPRNPTFGVGNFVDEAVTMHKWFLFGFIIFAFQMISDIYGAAAICCKNAFMLNTSNCSALIQCAYIVFIILGAIWRWSPTGSIAAGDDLDETMVKNGDYDDLYMIKSGMLMRLFLII